MLSIAALPQAHPSARAVDWAVIDWADSPGVHIPGTIYAAAPANSTAGGTIDLQWAAAWYGNFTAHADAEFTAPAATTTSHRLLPDRLDTAETSGNDPGGLLLASEPGLDVRVEFNPQTGQHDLVCDGTAGSDHVRFEQLGPTSVRVYIDKANGAASTWQGDFTGITGWVRARGGRGNDVLDASLLTSIRAELDGGFHDDLVIGGGAGDLLRGDEDGAKGDGAEGNDTILGGAGDDTIYGAGSDGAEGGDDSINGGSGNDWIEADGTEGGDDTVLGGSGDDTIRSRNGSDVIDGGTGNDRFEVRGNSSVLDAFAITAVPDAVHGTRVDVRHERTQGVLTNVSTFDLVRIETVEATAAGDDDRLSLAGQAGIADRFDIVVDSSGALATAMLTGGPSATPIYRFLGSGFRDVAGVANVVDRGPVRDEAYLVSHFTGNDAAQIDAAVERFELVDGDTAGLLFRAMAQSFAHVDFDHVSTGGGIDSLVVVQDPTIVEEAQVRIASNLAHLDQFSAGPGKPTYQAHRLDKLHFTGAWGAENDLLEVSRDGGNSVHVTAVRESATAPQFYVHHASADYLTASLVQASGRWDASIGSITDRVSRTVFHGFDGLAEIARVEVTGFVSFTHYDIDVRAEDGTFRYRVGWTATVELFLQQEDHAEVVGHAMYTEEFHVAYQALYSTQLLFVSGIPGGAMWIWGAGSAEIEARGAPAPIRFWDSTAHDEVLLGRALADDDPASTRLEFEFRQLNPGGSVHREATYTLRHVNQVQAFFNRAQSRDELSFTGRDDRPTRVDVTVATAGHRIASGTVVVPAPGGDVALDFSQVAAATLDGGAPTFGEPHAAHVTVTAPGQEVHVFGDGSLDAGEVAVSPNNGSSSDFVARLRRFATVDVAARGAGQASSNVARVEFRDTAIEDRYEVPSPDSVRFAGGSPGYVYTIRGLEAGNVVHLHSQSPGTNRQIEGAQPRLWTKGSLTGWWHPVTSEVTFADAELERAVRAALGLPTGAVISNAAIAGLTALVADSNRVASLAGLELATNLREFSLLPSDATQPSLLSGTTALLPLQSLTQLRRVTLVGAGLANSMLSRLSGLNQLTHLDLRGNQLTSVSALPVLPALESLDLSGNQLNSLNITGHAGFASLATVDLRYNLLSSITALTQLPALRAARLYGNPDTLDLRPLRGRLLHLDLPPLGIERATTIAEVAAALRYMPIAIYEWVYNHIEFEAYTGFMKGPEATLATRAGNSWDQAALLVELFKQAPAGLTSPITDGRLGLVRMKLNLSEAEALGWLGVTTREAAARVLAEAGVNAQLFNTGIGQRVVFENATHALVRVDFAGLGGGAEPLLLDPAFKVRDYQPGIPLLRDDASLEYIVGGAMRADYLSQVRAELLYEWYEDRVEDRLFLDYPGHTLSEIGHTGVIRQQAFDALPDQRTAPRFYSGAPHILRTGAEILAGNSAHFVNQDWTNLASVEWHRVEVLVQEEMQPGVLQQRIRQVFRISDVALRPLTLRWGGPAGLTPQLWRGLGAGAEVIHGSAPVAADHRVRITLSFFEHNDADSGNPNVDHQSSYFRLPGQVVAIGIEANQITDALLAELQQHVNSAVIDVMAGVSPFGQDDIAAFLAMAVTTYFRRVDQSQEVFDNLLRTQQIRDHVASGLASAAATPLDASALHTELMIPALPENVFVDVQDAFVRAVDVDRTSTLSANNAIEQRRRLLGGDNSSAQEHALWEELTNTPGMSTIKSLQVAAGLGIPVRSFERAAWPSHKPFFQNQQNLGLFPAAAFQYLVAQFEGAGQGVRADVPERVTPLLDWTEGIGVFLERTGGLDYMLIDPHLTGQGGVPVSDVPEAVVHVPSGANQSTAGDPVNVANGAVYDDMVDIYVPAIGLPLTLARHYDSSLPGDPNLGRGWYHTYSDTLTFSGNDVVWTTNQGHEYRFTWNAANSRFDAPAALHGEFWATPGSGLTDYTYRHKDGTTHVFRRIDGVAKGRLLRIEDQNGNQLRLSYENFTLGRLSVVQNYFRVPTAAVHETRGQRLTFAYDAAGRLAQVTDFTGRAWKYTNENGLLTAVEHPSADPASGQPERLLMRYTYYGDAATAVYLGTPVEKLLRDQITLRRQTGAADVELNRTTHRYYPNGRAFQTTGTLAGTETFFFDLYRRRTQHVDPRGALTSYSYNTQGQLVELLQADRAAETYVWNNHLQQSRTDALGVRERFEYGPAGGENQRLGNVTRTELRRFTGRNASGERTFNSYVNVDSTPLVTDYEYQTVRDAAERLVISQRSRVTQFSLSGAHRQRITEYHYDDPALNLTQVVDPELGVTRYAYTVAGLMTRQTRPRAAEHPGGTGLEHTTRYFYTWAGLPNRTISWVGKDASGGDVFTTEVFRYDDLPEGEATRGYLTSRTDGRGHTVTRTVDALGRVLTTTLPPVSAANDVSGLLGTAATTTHVYDVRGNRLSTTDTLGRTTQFQYDARNRVVRTILADGSQSRADFGFTGLVAHETDPLGHSSHYTYDVRQRLTGTRRGDGAHASTQYNGLGGAVVSHDALARATYFERDRLNRLVGRTDPDPDGPGGPASAPQWQFEYDAAGNRLREIDPLLRTTTFEYDKRDRLTRRLDPVPGLGQTQPIWRFTYYADGMLATETTPLNARTVYLYDGRGLPLGEEFYAHTSHSTPLFTTAATYDLAGNRVSATDRRGFTTDFEYDERNQLIRTRQPAVVVDGGGAAIRPLSQFGYDRAGNLVLSIDPRGIAQQTTYDARNRAVRIATFDGADPLTDPLVRSVATRYDRIGQAVAAFDPLGRITQFAYDAVGRVVSTVDALGSRSQQQFDARGNLVAAIDPLGRTTRLEYDALDRLTRRVLPDPTGNPNETAASPVWRFAYDAVGNLISQVDPRGATTSFVYDALNRLVERTQPATSQHAAPVTQYRYDAAGNLTREELLNLARVTTHTYDVLGRRLTTTGPPAAAGDPSPVWTSTWDVAGNLLTSTDPDGRRTAYVYDALGRLTSRTERLVASQPAGPTTLSAYDAAGNLVRTQHPDGSRMRYEYDALGRQVAATRVVEQVIAGQTVSRDETTRTQYDAAGQIVAIVDPLEHRRSFVYDALGRLRAQTDAWGAATRFEYDAVGNRTALVDPLGNATTYSYDALDRLTAETIVLDGQPRSRTYSNYTKTGVPQTITDRNGRVRNFVVDPYDRITQEQWKTAAGSTVRTILSQYNVAGELVDLQDRTGGATGPLISQSTFTYDGRSRLVESSFRSYVTQAPANNTVLAYQYTAASLPSSVAATVAGVADFLNTYTYDALGRLATLRQQAGGAQAVAPKRVVFTWNDAHQLTGITRYNHLTSPTSHVASSDYAYDSGPVPSGRLESITHRQGASGPVVARHALAHDAAGRVIGLASSGLAGSQQAQYAYHATDQLLAASYDFADDESFAYDVSGNRLAGEHVTGSYNRLIEDAQYTYAYDFEGNLVSRTTKATGLVRTYVWDHRNRLESVSETGRGVIARFAYDPLDRRVQKWEDRDGSGSAFTPEVHNFVWDQWGRIVLDRTSAGTVQHRYLHGPLVDQVLADENAAGTVHWPLADHQGTVRDVVDSSAALVEHLTYDAFGNLLGGADPLVAFTYTGQEYDAATGLYYYDARYYDAAVGRFTSEDPLGPDVDSNLYRYVRNNPVLYVDPTGKSPARPTTSSSSPSPLLWNSPLGDLGRGGGLLGPSWDFEISDPRSGGGTFSGDRWASTSLDYRLDVPTSSGGAAPVSVSSASQGRFWSDYWDVLKTTYVGNVGSTLKGYFWDGPVGVASGIYQAALDPRGTAMGLATAALHPIDTARAIRDDIVEKWQTSEGQGQLAFDVATLLAPAGLVAKAKYAQSVSGAARLAPTQVVRSAATTTSGTSELISVGRGLVGDVGAASRVGGVRSAIPTSIATPYGEAIQDASAAALRARAEIQSGARVYKGGMLGRSETGASQFLATESPLNPGYAGRYGVPPGNTTFDFILTGRVRSGAPVVTRPSPGIPPNPGGGIEGVVNPGTFIIDSFYMP